MTDQEQSDDESEETQDTNQYGGGDQDTDAVEQTEKRGVNEDDDEAESDEAGESGGEE